MNEMKAKDVVVCGSCGQALPGERKVLRSVIMALLMAISGLYLLNPTAGIFELIPDAIPIVGNLDEAAAVLLLFNGLRYFGIDVGTIWSNRRRG